MATWKPPIGAVLPDDPPVDGSRKPAPSAPRTKPPDPLAVVQRLAKQPSVIAALLVRTVERHERSEPPVGAVENGLFKALDTMPAAELTVLRESAVALRRIPAAVGAKLLDATVLDWPADKELPPRLVAERMLHEGLAAARPLLGAVLPGAPVWRPVRRTVQAGDTHHQVTAPFPLICDIEGVRTEHFIPTLGAYLPDEIDLKCRYTFDAQSQRASSTCVPRRGTCRAGSTQDGGCLRIVNLRPGSPVELHGVNLGDDRTTVRLRLHNRPDVTYTLPARGEPDRTTPRTDPAGVPIADCRVRDTLRFRMPTHAPNGVDEAIPGFYQVDVEVPNDTRAGIPQPPERLSTAQIRGTSWVRLLPAEDNAYRIWVDQLHCSLEQAGEPGSDEVSLLAVVANYHAEQEQPPTIDIVKTPPSVLQDVSEGHRYNFSFDLLGQGSVGVAVPEVLAIGLVGYEGDSEAALQEALRDWTSAFRRFFQSVWDQLKGSLASIGEALIGLGWAGLIVAAIAAVVILIIAIFWAAWAPPDLIMFDTVVLSASALWFITHPEAPMPLASREIHRPDDTMAVRVRVRPASKLDYLYTEWRSYAEFDRLPLLGLQRTSEYALRFRFQRLA